MVTRLHTQTKPAATPMAPFTLVRTGLLQRNCACGQKTGASVECDACRKKREANLQRAAINASSVSEVPPIVPEVLRSPGQPLDTTTRAFMEPRFGHDFSRVRVHTGARAAESARAVNALAYTVGPDVVFATEAYAPSTRKGQVLLAHELVHVVQQAQTMPGLQGKLRVGSPDDGLEREADTFTRRVLLDAAHDPLRAARVQPTLQKSNGDTIDVDLVPTSPEESERLKKMGVNLPKVSDETWRGIGGVADNARKTLSVAEKKRITELTKVSAPSGPALVFSEGPRFVLHDTGVVVGQKRMKELQSLGRGPLGEAAAAYVPAAGDAVVARPFFETKRPTATQYERGQDILKKADREKEYRNVWKATKATEHQPALDRALDGLGLSPKETAKEQKDAIAQLSATSGEVRSTAAWAVEELCKQVATSGVKSMAASEAQEKALETACTNLSGLFAARTARISSSVNVEIVQQTGSDCRTTGKLQPLPKPAYTPDQYRSVMLLYLQAALQAGRFPEITTHFWLDRIAGDHCDPRCFELTLLYDLISAALGHGKGSTYGVKPSYGTVPATHNVWWHDTVCGGTHS